MGVDPYKLLLFKINHGLGLVSVKNIIKRQAGSYFVTVTDTTFETNVELDNVWKDRWT